MKRLTAPQYLGKVAPARALYRVLFEEAIGRLADAPMPERLESFMSTATLAKRLGVGTSTIGGDLALLFNFGWIERAQGPAERHVRQDAPRRFLGHREGITLYLIADAQALARTGEDRLVSRVVLAGLLPDIVAQCADPPPPVERGVNRRWQPEPPPPPRT